MANNFDPELIGRLLVVLRRHPLGKLKRDYLPYRWYGDGHQRRSYFLQESYVVGLAWGEIRRHLDFMAKVGLIKHSPDPASTEAEWPDWGELNQWQLCSDEEFGAGFASSGGGGNNDGNDGGGGQGEDGGQGGGRGIGEVLGHPVLFSLPEPEFDALVGGLFEGPGAP